CRSKVGYGASLAAARANIHMAGATLDQAEKNLPRTDYRGCTVKAPSEPNSNTFDLEEFAKNLARMIEQGGKAMAAYMKPREQGRIEGEHAEFVDVVKTFGQVAQYWLRDPQRAVELQLALSKSYLDLWANAVKRMAGEPSTPLIEPEARDKRFA